MSNRFEQTTLVRLVLIIGVVLCLCERSSSQDYFEATKKYNELVSETSYAYSLAYTGGFSYIPSIERRYVTPLRLLRLLGHDQIAPEIELLDYQVEEIDKSIRNLEAAIAEADELYDAYVMDRDTLEEKTVQQLGPICQESMKKVNSVIVNFQSERLKQIFLQFEISQRGIIWFLESSHCKSLQLSAAERQKIRRVFVDTFNDSKADIEKCKEAVASKIHSKVAGADTNQELQGNPVPLAVLRAQISSTNFEAAKKLISKQARWPRFLGLGIPSQFRINCVGEVEIVLDPERIDHVDDVIASNLISFCRSCREMKLTDSQSKQFKLLSQELHLFYADFESRKDEYVEEHGWESQSVFIAENSDELDSVAAAVVRSVEELLSPSQSEILLRFADRCEQVCQGPLTHSLLAAKKRNQELVELDEIIEVLDKERESIAKLLVDIETKVNQAVRQALTVKQREALHQVLGPSLKLEKGNVELHLVFMNDRKQLQPLVDLFSEYSNLSRSFSN